MPRPLYTPEHQIQKALYTAGNELQVPDETGQLQNYIGLYHIYPNGSIYSGAVYDPVYSVELTRIASGHLATDVNDVYFNITGIDKTYESPRYFIPDITPEDVKRGTVPRFLVQQINELDNITEIDRPQFNLHGSIPRGIDPDRFRKTSLTWTIAGPREDVQKANIRALVAAEYDMPGIRVYLSDPLEFYQ